MTTLTLEIPDEIDVPEIRKLVALSLWEKRSVTMGEASEIAGLDREGFMVLLGERGYPVFDYPADLEREARR